MIENLILLLGGLSALLFVLAVGAALADSIPRGHCSLRNRDLK